ncbi:hypothetical protein IV203_021806 [Nitzschia inconspicua]|uniref:Uncharacterized protein n=1 Tax=Nitzschia inconspicua TaxID=303405 RepID=A0A9K3PDS1_9STRA|nr:hypothetical protein IV203_021806 [Nitzschia inconspicua]
MSNNIMKSKKSASFSNQRQQLSVRTREHAIENLSEDEIVFLFFLLVAVLIVLIIVTLKQCENLQQTMLERRRWKRDHGISSDSISRRKTTDRSSKRSGESDLFMHSSNDIQEQHVTVKRNRQASYQELQVEVQHMRQLQQDVRSQVSMLEEFVEQRQQAQHRQQSKPYNDASTNSSQASHATDTILPLGSETTLRKRNPSKG